MSNSVTHVNPASLLSSPVFSQAVRIPAGADLLIVGGQNGVGPDGVVVGPGVREQTERAAANLAVCLEEAGAAWTDVVKWTILAVEGTDMQEGLAAFPAWPGDGPPPAITVAFVSALAVPGALVEIEALAAVVA